MAEIREQKYTLRLSKKEYEYLQAQAEKYHCAISQIIRMSVFKGEKDDN